MVSVWSVLLKTLTPWGRSSPKTQLVVTARSAKPQRIDVIPRCDQRREVGWSCAGATRTVAAELAGIGKGVPVADGWTGLCYLEGAATHRDSPGLHGAFHRTSLHEPGPESIEGSFGGLPVERFVGSAFHVSDHLGHDAVLLFKVWSLQATQVIQPCRRAKPILVRVLVGCFRD